MTQAKEPRETAPATKKRTKAAPKAPAKTTKKKTTKRAPAKKAAARPAAKTKKAAPSATKKTAKRTSKATTTPDSSPRQAEPTAQKTPPRGAKPDTPSRMGAKPDQQSETSARSLIEDFDALSEYVADVSGKSQEVVREFFGRNADMMDIAQGRKSADPLNVREALKEVLEGLAADPGTVMQRQFNLWGDYAKLFATMSRRFAGEDVKPAVEPRVGDKRFNHPAWQDNHMLDFIKQSYLTYANWLQGTVSALAFDDDMEKRRAQFYTQQFLDAISPTNVPVLNPEVVEATVDTRGENLMKGLKHLLEDIDRGHGELAIRQADLDFFKLGENVATTPGKVVYQNEIMQLIQYDPLTEKVAERPLLIFPPWINKFYILDLQPKNSFIRWMVEQGRTVFVVSWVNPGPELGHKTFEDYITEGCFEALDAVEKATGVGEVDAIGYCIGGTMLATALALMAKRGDERIKSATYFTAQADFEEAGDLLLFIDDAQLNSIEKQMDAAGGVLEGRSMATTFNMLRSNDLIWQFVIDNYMKGKDPARFDLLFWNSDSTRMPKDVHLFYLREFYQKNCLAKGGMTIDGAALDLTKVNIPMFFQAGETDHIAPHNSVYRTAKLFASGGNNDVRYMLAGSGHIAGVINHPDKNKYHHSINTDLPENLETWKENAERRPGSWWSYWMAWLDEISPGHVAARWPGDGDLVPIEDAPGSYVKVQS